MPRPRLAVPSYRRHRPSGLAVVTLTRADGAPHDIYLGPYGSDESRAAYARVVAELRSGTVAQSLAAGPDGATVGDLIVRFMQHAPIYYRHADGRPTSEVKEFRYALRPLAKLYPDLPVAGFGPRALKVYRQALIDAGICRKRINKQVGRVRRVFAWGVEEQIVTETGYATLLLVKGLRKGRSEARESEDVGPVDWPCVEKTLPHLTPTVGVEHRRPADQRPRPPDQRVEEQPGLVDQDEVRVRLARFFWMRGQSFANPSRTNCSAASRSGKKSSRSSSGPNPWPVRWRMTRNPGRCSTAIGRHLGVK